MDTGRCNWREKRDFQGHEEGSFTVRCLRQTKQAHSGPALSAAADYIWTKASFGALQTGQAQSSGRSANFLPSFASSYTYPHTVHLHMVASSARKSDLHAEARWRPAGLSHQRMVAQHSASLPLNFLWYSMVFCANCLPNS